jgi:hypothetical protein
MLASCSEEQDCKIRVTNAIGTTYCVDSYSIDGDCILIKFNDTNRKIKVCGSYTLRIDE